MLSFKQIDIGSTARVQLSPFSLTFCYQGDNDRWKRCQVVAEARIRRWFEDTSATLVSAQGENDRHALLHDMLALQDIKTIDAAVIKNDEQVMHWSMDSHLFFPPHLIEAIFEDWLENNLISEREHHAIIASLQPSLINEYPDNFYDLCEQAYQSSHDEEASVRRLDMTAYLKSSASTYFDVIDEEGDAVPAVQSAMKRQFIDWQLQRYQVVLDNIHQQYAHSQAEKDRLESEHKRHAILKAVEKSDYLLVMSDVLENIVRMMYCVHKSLVGSLYSVTETLPVVGALVQGVGYLASPAKRLFQKNKKKKVNKLSMGLKVVTGVAMTSLAIAGLLVPPLGLALATAALGASIGISVYKHQRTRRKLHDAKRALTHSLSSSSLTSLLSDSSQASHEYQSQVIHYKKKFKKRSIETGLLIATTGLLAVSLLCPPLVVPCVATIAAVNVGYLGYKAISWGRKLWNRTFSSSSISSNVQAERTSLFSLSTTPSNVQAERSSSLDWHDARDASEVSTVYQSVDRLSSLSEDDVCATEIASSDPAVSGSSFDQEEASLSTAPAAVLEKSSSEVVNAASQALHAIERVEELSAASDRKTYAECHPNNKENIRHSNPVDKGVESRQIKETSFRHSESASLRSGSQLSLDSEKCLNREFDHFLHPLSRQPVPREEDQERDRKDDGEQEVDEEREGEGGATLHA